MMKKLIATAMIGSSLFSALTFAQADPNAPSPTMETYLKCLQAAVAQEQSRSAASLERVKSACSTEYQVLARELPADLLNEVMALIDEGLRRELHL